MTTPIQIELAQTFNRLNEIGSAVQHSGWDITVFQATHPEAVELIKRRRQLWESQEAKDLGLNGGVDHEIFY